MRSAAAKSLRNARVVAKPSRALARNYATVRDPLQKDPVELDQITELPNGVRIASESLPGPFSGVGVYIDAGSRYEDESLRGVSHIVDRLAFKSTKQRSADQMLEALEALGGNIQCASSREALMYQSATFNSAVPDTIALLAETIRDPLITDEEVQQQLETAEYEIQEIWSKPDLIIPELLHMAAYKDNTLGNPLLCPRERLPYITRGLIEKYRNLFYKPERIVVAFAGIEHEKAVRLAEKYFGDMPRGNKPSVAQDNAQPSTAESPTASTQSETPSTPSATSRFLSKIPGLSNFSTSAPHQATVSPLDPSLLQSAPVSPLTQPSHYTGGFLALPPLPPPQNNLSIPLSHVHIAFEALPISSEDIYAQATLQTLLGGGGSFSAGGPGKGMYSRLYTNVLNQHGWVESCVAFNHSYTDSGLFGIAGACEPGRVGHMVDVMCRELQALTLESGFPSLQLAEVNRAKNQLRFSLLMNLESRLVELEDLGRQVQVHGRKVGVKEMCAKIDALTVTDLRRVAKQILTGQVHNRGHGTGAPTVVIQEGEDGSGKKIRQIPWEDVQSRIARWKLGRM
ncbi:Mitochondrial-processing peptidase subunit alpha [Exophiala dermatitidis]|uniref:Mitochondrial-processing peptidase subunit alpha n=1 Tax=Exophiala dermatitidis (strain ATCC 34100 / CBS 525.76 / NIH/UT8656) TaxID=858893 RepID=H6BNB5_EXODN|nr:mitochondrial processing peptidase [Exophiala dermatitidis NIH/UT8656]EHY53183.1 mitochondrial processing peptidase [Exophiala dermatitidis NIH/UT8656]